MGSQLILWEVQSGRELVLVVHADHIPSLAYSPNGKYLVAVVENTVRIWNATSYQEVLTLEGYTGAITGLVFSPDSTRIATIEEMPDELPGGKRTARAEVKVRDTKAGYVLFSLVTSHGTSFSAVSFSPDSSRLVTNRHRGKWNEVTIWDASTGQEFLSFHTAAETLLPVGSSDAVPTPNRITQLVFSPDAQRLVAVHELGSVTVWDATPLDQKPARPNRAPLSAERLPAPTPDQDGQK
jgi:WD40 repeat protein